MKNCQDPGGKIWFSTVNKKTRKYAQTWQFIEVSDCELVGINTSLANRLVLEAIENGVIKQIANFSKLRTEVSYGAENSRIDILLEDSHSRCFIEVKNVSFGVSGGIGLFPDAITVRGQKHLRELINVKKAGDRAILVFCVQHTGVDRISPADNIDPVYADLLRKALAVGVEVIAYQADIDISSSTIRLEKELPFIV
jgi:sugar fermentation stimulation protein A